jgi:hypothetical protein
MSAEVTVLHIRSGVVMAENQLITQDQPRRRDPFVVTVHGHHRRFPAPSAQLAHDLAAELRRRAPGVDISWMLLPSIPMPAEFCGRYLARNGLAESQRVAHLFLLSPGVAVDEATVLNAWCCEPIRADLLEILPGRVGGMPCNRCLARISAPDVPAAEINQQDGERPLQPPRNERDTTSALAEVDQRHTDPRWLDLDVALDPDTPIAREVWADLHHGRLGVADSGARAAG